VLSNNECRARCAADSSCNFYLWRYDTDAVLSAQYTCAGFSTCPSTTAFADGDGGNIYQSGVCTTDKATYCGTSPPSPSQKTDEMKKNIDAAQAAADNLNNNDGKLVGSTAEATQQRVQLIKEIGTLVSTRGATASDLATVSAEEKQQVIGAAVDALSSVVANASELDGPRGGSEIAQVRVLVM